MLKQKIILTLAILFISLLNCQAQGAGGTFSNENYHLNCEMTVYLKNGKQLQGKLIVNGTNTKSLDVSYQEIDSIKTHEHGLYEFVNIGKKEPNLFKRIVIGKGISIYESRPKMKSKGGGATRNAQGQVTGVNTTIDSIQRKFYFQKIGEKAIEFPKKGKDLTKYFESYPCIIEKYKDNAVYKGMNHHIFVEYYDSNCLYVERYLND